MRLAKYMPANCLLLSQCNKCTDCSGWALSLLHLGAHWLQVVALANLLPPDSNTDELDSYMYQTVSER
jgi:hypothetical protein